jgi:hypothetical protein
MVFYIISIAMGLLYFPTTSSFIFHGSLDALAHVQGQGAMVIDKGSIRQSAEQLFTFKGAALTCQSKEASFNSAADILCSACYKAIFSQVTLMNHVTEEDLELFDAWSCHKESFKIFSHLSSAPSEKTFFHLDGSILCAWPPKECPSCHAKLQFKGDWISSSSIFIKSTSDTSVFLTQRLKRSLDNSSCFHFCLGFDTKPDIAIHVISHEAYVWIKAAFLPCLVAQSDLSNRPTSIRIKMNDLFHDQLASAMKQNQIKGIGFYMLL